MSVPVSEGRGFTKVAPLPFLVLGALGVSVGFAAMPACSSSKADDDGDTP